MARRARSAVKSAATADTLQAKLLATRKKLSDLRKELNLTRVQLNLNVEDDRTDSDGETGPESESEDSCSDEEITWKRDSERDLALKRMQSMPTWRLVRGKGKGRGQAKLEWGTRIIIYALLAMMVPASAVGMVIVAIVKRTAPWLNPASPTYETVKRCRFELRFVEEVCLFHEPTD